jgi:hypothetical protein
LIFGLAPSRSTASTEQLHLGVCESAATRRKDKVDFIFVEWTGAAGKVSLGF